MSDEIHFFLLFCLVVLAFYTHILGVKTLSVEMRSYSYVLGIRVSVSRSKSVKCLGSSSIFILLVGSFTFLYLESPLCFKPT